MSGTHNDTFCPEGSRDSHVRLLATLLLASPALSNPTPMPTRLPAGPVSLDAFKGWGAVPVAVMINGQITTQWMLVPTQAVSSASPAPQSKAPVNVAEAWAEGIWSDAFL